MKVSIAVGDYVLTCAMDGLPDTYGHYGKHAELVEEFDLEEPEGTTWMLAIERGVDWPFLVVAQRYRTDGGFSPGVLLIPETGLLFIGAGERLLGYKLDRPERLWIDHTPCGFWGWARHGDRVIVSAEHEIAAWDLQGRKQWSYWVEPPWTYRVAEGIVCLDVMGAKFSFPNRRRTRMRRP